MISNCRIRLGVRAAQIVFALGASGLVGGAAHARTEVLRWSYAEPGLAAGFEVHIGDASQIYNTVHDVGRPAADTHGVFSASIEVPDDVTVYVAVRAYADDGERSALSNEKQLDAPAPAPLPPPGDDGGDTGGGGTDGGDTGGGGTDGGDTGGGGTDGGDTGGGGTDGGDTGGGGATAEELLVPVQGALFYEDFETRSTGNYVPGWVDTTAGSKLTENDGLFRVTDLGANRVLATLSTETNIHSHYAGGTSASWSAYELRGRMRLGSAQGGVGVTAYSRYDDADVYYRLRRYQDTEFHLSMHPGLDCANRWTQVKPQPDAWYVYRLQVVPQGFQTTIRAKVWREGSGEPAGWQASCTDPSGARPTAGRIGTWSMGPGSEYLERLPGGPAEHRGDAGRWWGRAAAVSARAADPPALTHRVRRGGRRRPRAQALSLRADPRPPLGGRASLRRR